MPKMDTKSTKNNEFHHYYISSNQSENDFFTFEANVNDYCFKFTSCPDVFSKNELDYGSLVLVKTILKRADQFGNKILDMCSGYGTIGVILSKFIVGDFALCDINETAIKLAKLNAELNKTNIKSDQIFVSNLFENVHEQFDHIVSNPPIKVGKQVLLDFAKGSYDHLLKDGSLTVVIKKNLGADSFKKYLISLFGNCEVWERDKGYYILHSIK